MKLTEKQLASLFQTNSKNHTSNSSASDCLAASGASTDRLNHLEDLINDHSTAQALKVSTGLKDWSQTMAKSIDNSQHSWFNFWGMNSPMKTAFAAFSFAFAFAVALPQFSANLPVYQATPQTYISQSDFINSIPFESNDNISQGGFDSSSEQDGLFNANFG